MTREEILAKEREYNDLCDAYEAQFGVNYGVDPADPRTREEHIAEIKECMRTNTPASRRYFEGVV